MGPIEIIVIALAAALVVFSVVYNVVRKIRNKKRGITCDCDGTCSSCGGCTAADKKSHN